MQQGGFLGILVYLVSRCVLRVVSAVCMIIRPMLVLGIYGFNRPIVLNRALLVCCGLSGVEEKGGVLLIPKRA